MIGTAVDRYEILEELGHGGMSVVYRGMDASLEREVAVKVLHQHLAKKLENRKRFHREAKAIARLRHPNILEIYDFSSEDAEKSYIVMEYIQGSNLRQFVGAHGTPPPEIAALVGVEICNALEHAHDHGVIHRDLKPENVMVSNEGVLKLMDFGIAHVIDAETMTQTGSLMGSPAHMAPELVEGEKVDVRADVFSLGTVLYWLATGSLPFEGANAPQVLKKVLEGVYDPADAVEPRVGARMASIVATCLERDPDDRYADVAAVREELVSFAAAAGLGEADEELKRYFSNPEAYAEQFAEEIVEHLLEQAASARRQKNVPRAVAIYNRVLAYEPDNAEVQAYLASLDRRRALWRVAAGLAAAAAVVTAGWWLANRPAEQPTPKPTTATQTPAAASAIASALDASRTRAAKATADAKDRGTSRAGLVVEDAEQRTEETARRPRAPSFHAPTPHIQVSARANGPDAGAPDAAAKLANREVQKYRYRFALNPAAATLFVDGEPYDGLRAAGGIELTEGVHRLRATSAGAVPWHQTLLVKGPQRKTRSVVLHWKPGTLRVVSNVPAMVRINDGKLKHIGANGRNASFHIPFGAADDAPSKKNIALSVASDEDIGRPQHHRVSLRPGELTTVTVNFEPLEN